MSSVGKKVFVAMVGAFVGLFAACGEAECSNCKGAVCVYRQDCPSALCQCVKVNNGNEGVCVDGY